MGDISNGPVRTMPGSRHSTTSMCDEHPDRPATVRIQGETDSFGCEYYDMCEECHVQYKAEIAAAGPDIGTCEWCNTSGVEIKRRRDFDEGLAGRLYDVCSPCWKDHLNANNDY